MKKLDVQFQRSPDDVLNVGTLAEQNHRLYFEFDAAFVDTGLDLSPIKLPLAVGLVEHSDLAFGPLPGLFDDSLPDGWGLLLMDRYYRREGIDPSTLSPLDRLAYLGTRTMGALTYHPPRETEQVEGMIDLYRLGRNAQEVINGDADEVLPQLTRAGGSPGGARPKVLVGIDGDRIMSGEDDLPDGFEHWLVKFASQKDDRDAGPVEYAYSLMARAAGIDMPPTRLFEARRGRSIRRHFGARRFDRGPGNRRFHVHTFGNLIQTNFRIPSTDYTDLFKVTRRLTRDHQASLRMFRRMVFNVAAHNRDDHAKNFAFLLDDQDGEWHLAPAYDLTFSSGPGGEHTTTILGEGRAPGLHHCLRLAETFGIKPREMGPILDQVNAAVDQWPNFADQAQCTRKIMATVAKGLFNL